MNLTLATVNELIEELLNRCDDGVVILRKNLPSGQRIYKSRNKGSLESTVFLLTQEREFLIRDYNEKDESPEPWEEF